MISAAFGSRNNRNLDILSRTHRNNNALTCYLTSCWKLKTCRKAPKQDVHYYKYSYQSNSFGYDTVTRMIWKQLTYTFITLIANNIILYFFMIVSRASSSSASAKCYTYTYYDDVIISVYENFIVTYYDVIICV